MAAITPSNILRVSGGSTNRVIATFTTVADGDTWASGITAIGGFVIQINGNPSTQASAGSAGSYSAGTFTFYPGENSLGCYLYVDIE